MAVPVVRLSKRTRPACNSPRGGTSRRVLSSVESAAFASAKMRVESSSGSGGTGSLDRRYLDLDQLAEVAAAVQVLELEDEGVPAGAQETLEDERNRGRNRVTGALGGLGGGIHGRGDRGGLHIGAGSGGLGRWERNAELVAEGVEELLADQDLAVQLEVEGARPGVVRRLEIGGRDGERALQDRPALATAGVGDGELGGEVRGAGGKVGGVGVEGCHPLARDRRDRRERVLDDALEIDPAAAQDRRQRRGDVVALQAAAGELLENGRSVDPIGANCMSSERPSSGYQRRKGPERSGDRRPA